MTEYIFVVCGAALGCSRSMAVVSLDIHTTLESPIHTNHYLCIISFTGNITAAIERFARDFLCTLLLEVVYK